MEDFKKRSLAKAISWRVTASVTTMLIVYIFTGKAALSFGVGVIEAFSKMLLYYLHERGWQRIKWGRHPLASIRLNRETLSQRDLEIISEKLKELGYL
ncbi:MAG: hypothetical protein DRG40_05070 [Deltaproteobacteria bacterium]|nr:MAG: hypothetical protein DRG40_05070 [Deltaproteobacteria bacterium]